MTERTTLLFHDQAYERSTRAVLTRADRDERGALYVVLDRTVFHPQGGGQKGDRGHLTPLDAEAVPIVDTRKDGDLVHHYVEADESWVHELVGSEVSATLDWGHRYQQMRVHSAVHLIHCFLEVVRSEEIPHPRQSPLTSEGGEIHYDHGDRFDEADLAAATERMNAFIAEGGHAIATHADTERGPGFRWWRCEGWAIPCGGTHPLDAGEIGPVSTRMRLKKGRARLSVSLDR